MSVETDVFVTLSNGTKISGSRENVFVLLKELADKSPNYNYSSTHYYSESGGVYIPIKEMETRHLRNAILKRYRKWVLDLSNVSNSQKLVKMLMQGINEILWLNMVEEYSTREEE
jgi:hypothetical protein